MEVVEENILSAKLFIAGKFWRGMKNFEKRLGFPVILRTGMI